MLTEMRKFLAAFVAATESLADEINWHLDGLEAWAERLTAPHFDTSTWYGRAGQTGAVLSVVTLGITLLIATLIYSQIQSSLPQPQNAELQNASANVTSQFADVMNLAPVIMVVLIAGVVLAVVQRFGGG